MADPCQDELTAERAAVAAINAAHDRQLSRARRVAEGLAAEAAEATEDGIRDLVDEDAEVDAAVAAALVRQTSDRAMHAMRRVAELEARGAALAFGYTTNDAGQRCYVGRMSVISDDEALLVDWRAQAAVPFYRATPLERLEVRHRRHLLFSTENDLAGYSDEVFDLDTLSSTTGLRGEAAILASVTAPTQEQMRSVVATIQAEQDAVIRAPSSGALVVQGGPGTGKTVVALHRAAYLLYENRAALADSGILVVGPSNEFLRYIAGVLPSLGETGVVSVTPPKLYPGILLGTEESVELAGLKGSQPMANFLAAAVKDRQRRPRAALNAWHGSLKVHLSVEEAGCLFDRASRHVAHNDGADEFRSLLADALAAKVYNPSFDNLEDARVSFRRSAEVTEYLLRHFPPLTPERALRDLFGSTALIRSAAVSVSQEGAAGQDSASQDLATAPAKLLALQRPTVPEAEIENIRWTDADVPLLDELQALLGGSMAQTEEERIRARDAQDFFELALEEDLSNEVELDDSSLGELFEDEGRGEFDDRAVASEDEEESDEDEVITELEIAGADDLDEAGSTVVELAFGQTSWRFGHVIVDEAQDLTAMQWRMIVRRARGGSMTIVGDLAQRSIGLPGSWRQHLPPEVPEFTYRELTINYRSPSEVNRLASEILKELAPNLSATQSIRSSGHDPVFVPLRDLEDAIVRHCPPDSAAAVIGVDLGPRPQWLKDYVQWLTPRQAKGLEFDSVFVVEPAEIVKQPYGLSLLYVAITRTTGRLVVAHEQPLPAVLGGLSA